MGELTLGSNFDGGEVSMKGVVMGFVVRIMFVHLYK
jgi:hypothetical protein